MARTRITGLVLLAIGLVFLAFAYHSTTAPLEELSNTMTGRYSDGTMWYFFIGVAAAVGGGLLAAFGSRK